MRCETVDDYDPEKDYSYLLCDRCGMCKCHACKCDSCGAKFYTRFDDVSDDNDFDGKRDDQFYGLRDRLDVFRKWSRGRNRRKQHSAR